MGWRVRKINKKMRDLVHGSPSVEKNGAVSSIGKEKKSWKKGFLNFHHEQKQVLFFSYGQCEFDRVKTGCFFFWQGKVAEGEKAELNERITGHLSAIILG